MCIRDRPRHSGTLRSRIFKWTFGPLPAAAAATPIGSPIDVYKRQVFVLAAGLLMRLSFALQDYEEKQRKIIGEEFIRVFEEQAKKIGRCV